jgi:hypothetical protein
LVSFKPQPLYFKGKNTRFSLGRRLGGLQSRSFHGDKEKIVASAGIRIEVVQPVAKRHVD